MSLSFTILSTSAAVVLATLPLLRRRYRRRHTTLSTSLSSDDGRIPVVLVTDIGRDIDDTVAFMALAGAREKVRIVGVLTSGGQTALRATVVRGWLQRLGLDDDKTDNNKDKEKARQGIGRIRIPVAACLKPSDDRLECFVPPGFPSMDEANLEQAGAAALLLRLVKEHHGRLVLACIAPLTPVFLALDSGPDAEALLQSGLRAVYIQGQATVEDADAETTMTTDTDTNTETTPPFRRQRRRRHQRVLAPDRSAFNLREDLPAARRVMSSLQRHIPFTFLGKHAAYRVDLTKSDFAAWNRPGLPRMLPLVRQNMDGFRRNNPSLFYRLYEVPELGRNDAQWFDHVTTCSHPYDPLLILALLRPELFQAELICCCKEEEGEVEDKDKDKDKDKDDGVEGAVQRQQQQQQQHVHRLIGNDAGHDGVPDPLKVHHALCRLVCRGVDAAGCC